MWNRSLIAGPLGIPAERDSDNNVVAWHPGYHLLVGAEVVTTEVEEFVTEYTEAPLVFAGVEPIYLTFASEEEARMALPAEHWQTVEIDSAFDSNPVPAFVTPRQMRLALIDAGLDAMVEQFVATKDKVTKTSWEYATQIERNDAFIQSAVTALGWDKEKADDLFRAAAKL